MGVPLSEVIGRCALSDRRFCRNGYNTFEIVGSVRSRSAEMVPHGMLQTRHTKRGTSLRRIPVVAQAKMGFQTASYSYDKGESASSEFLG